jgi:hypothetical protein
MGDSEKEDRVSAKDRLVHLLDQKVFQPILKAEAGDFAEAKREKLEHVQRATESELERFRHYGSAREVYEIYRDDLRSDAAEPVNRDLQDLGLPTLQDVRDEFERLAEEVGAKS